MRTFDMGDPGMDNSKFAGLSQELRELAANIPLHWGSVQNNYFDSNISMFDIGSYSELERQIAHLDDGLKMYFRRRWYLWQCSQCDEYLFYCLPNVIKNPKKKDKEWDIRINGTIDYDVKGTVIPRDMRGSAEAVIADPTAMVKFFYDKQSKGVRFDMQNRLFVVHHSFVSQEREFYLRCAWGSKERAYKLFVENIDRVKTFSYQGCTAAVIFVLEREQGRAEERGRVPGGA